MENVVKECKMCKKEFKTNVVNRAYCSMKCRNKMSSINRQARKKEKELTIDIDKLNNFIGISENKAIKEPIKEPINENELNDIKKENETLKIELINTQKRLSQLTHELSFFRLLTIKQTANILKITPKTVHKLIKEYDIDTIKVSERKTLIRYTDYLELLDLFE